MAKRDPRTGELLTTNYSWTKPTVGSSVDAWGGYVNADLDAIDSVVHGIQTSVPAASTTTPAMNGTAAVGTGTTWARADHVHPTDVRIIGDSRIINGDMLRDQRNNGASGSANGYTVDRWRYSGSQPAKGAWQQVAGFPAQGFPYALAFTSTSAYAVVAADVFAFLQVIEADMVSDFAWGTAQAQPVTLSFWVQSTLTGTFSGSIRNAADTRSYPFTFSIPVASTPTKISITIPGDTGGTWVMSGNNGALNVVFSLGAGSTGSGPANAWASANYISASGAVSVVGTNGAVFWLTGVKLEIGSVATPYNRQSLAASMADCQRYYQSTYGLGYAPGAVVNPPYAGLIALAFTTGTYFNFGTMFPVQMRAVPSITLYSQSGVVGNVSINSINSTATAVDVLTTGFGALQNTSGSTWAQSSVLKAHWVADAEL